eukprot:UC4_evm1s2
MSSYKHIWGGDESTWPETTSKSDFVDKSFDHEAKAPTKMQVRQPMMSSKSAGKLASTWDKQQLKSVNLPEWEKGHSMQYFETTQSADYQEPPPPPGLEAAAEKTKEMLKKNATQKDMERARFMESNKIQLSMVTNVCEKPIHRRPGRNHFLDC